MKLVPTLALGVALLGSGAALAQPAGPGPSPGARMFELMDNDHNGRISWDESWAFATSRFNAADADRSNGLTLQEFGTMRFMGGRVDVPASPAPRPGQAERMEQMRGAMFRSFDANGDGIVTLTEIQPFAQARFRAMDANSDGSITRDELPRRGPSGHHRGQQRGERGAPAAPAAPAQ